MTLSRKQVRQAVDLGMRAAAVTVSGRALTRHGIMNSEDSGRPVSNRQPDEGLKQRLLTDPYPDLCCI